MSLRDHLGETKPNQEKLRGVQRQRDRGNTFGNEYKHPCMKVN